MERSEDFNCCINLRTLAQGRSKHSFKLKKEFFESFGNEDITPDGLVLEVEVDKSHRRVGAFCEVKGNVVVACDRCMEDLSLEVDIEKDFTIKFTSYASEDEQTDEGIILLESNDGDLDLSQVMYDYIILSLPLIKVHPEGECDPEVMKKLEEILR